MALHCPATLHIARVDGEDAAVQALAATLREERVAAVITSPLRPALASAELAASLLGVTHETHPGLGAGQDAGLAATLTDIADRFRGEHLLVLGEMTGAALLDLAVSVPPGARARPHLPTGRAARVEVGDDGVVVRDWPGEAASAGLS